MPDGAGLCEEECSRVFKHVDKNGDGGIDFSEFVEVLMNDKPQMLRNASHSVLDKLRGAQKRSLLRTVLERARRPVHGPRRPETRESERGWERSDLTSEPPCHIPS